MRGLCHAGTQCSHDAWQSGMHGAGRASRARINARLIAGCAMNIFSRHACGGLHTPFAAAVAEAAALLAPACHHVPKSSVCVLMAFRISRWPKGEMRGLSLSISNPSTCVHPLEHVDVAMRPYWTIPPWQCTGTCNGHGGTLHLNDSQSCGIIIKPCMCKCPPAKLIELQQIA